MSAKVEGAGALFCVMGVVCQKPRQQVAGTIEESFLGCLGSHDFGARKTLGSLKRGALVEG